MTNYWQKRAYAELSTEPGDLAKRGLVFLMSQKFSIASAGSVMFSLDCNGVSVEIQSYELSSTGEAVYAELIESASATAYGTAISARNMNRNYSTSHTAVLKSASAVSGGTVIATELFGDTKAGGGLGSSKIFTLSASNDYIMSFTNLGNQTATAHINFAWSENEPTHPALVTSTWT